MVRNRKETTEKSKKKPGLSTQIFIALLAGALLGVVIHYWIPSSYIKDTVIVEGVLYVIGQGFIRLMQMLVVPLVFCSLVCGSMSIGDSKTLGKVGVKTIGFYLVTTALAVCIALGTALLIHPGLGLNMSAVQKSRPVLDSSRFQRQPGGYTAQHHPEEPDWFHGKRRYASHHRIRPVCRRNAGKARKPRFGRFQLYQPV